MTSNIEVTQHLDFELPLIELERKIKELENFSSLAEVDLVEEIKKLRTRADRLRKDIYRNLTPWQRVLIARHPNRPDAKDLIHAIFSEFVELHGDRSFRDDPALVSGFARLGEHKVMAIATRKGKTMNERIAFHFGCPHPEGYRKALLKMQLAEKLKLPIITFINTPGAYPGIGAEERGQALAIAKNLFEMTKLKVPIICVVTGEGGSGGALAIGVGDRLFIMENAYFSVISPEGCAAILWRDSKYAPDAAKMLKLTAKELFNMEIVDEIIAEPAGGAHRDYKMTSEAIKNCLIRHLEKLIAIPLDTLIQQRYDKYRCIGRFLEKQMPKVMSGSPRQDK